MALPFPQLGKHVTIFTIQGLVAGTGGTLTPGGTAVSLWGVRRSHGLSSRTTSSEINSASRPFDNEIPISSGRTFNLEIFLVNNGTDPNPLETLVESYDFMRAIWTSGTISGAIEAQQFDGSRGDLDTSYQGRGETIATFELRPIDTGWAATAAGAGAAGQLTRVIS